MATESPIRLLDGTDKWPPLKQSAMYRPSSAKMAIEDLNFFLKGQNFQNLEKDVIPSRSESAPPSMESSTAAAENIFSERKSTLNPGSVYPSGSAVNCESELHFHADPSSSLYHSTDVRLNRRSIGNLNSSVNPHLFQLSCSSGSDRKTTHAKCADGSLQFSRNSLPGHQEEQDVQSSGRSASVSVEKTALLGCNSGPLGSTKEDSHHASSSAHDLYGSLDYKSIEDTAVSDVDSHIKCNLTVSISTGGTYAPCSDDNEQVASLDGTRDFNALKFNEQDNLSTAGAGDVDSAHVEVVKMINVTSSSNSEPHKFQKKEQIIHQNNAVSQQAVQSDGNTSQARGNYSPIIYSGVNACAGLNQFNYVTSSVNAGEVQPILHSSGFTPPLYATAANFTTSPNQFYPNLQPAGFFTPQYSVGGYYFSPAVLPSYLAGYPHQGAIPLAFGGESFCASRVTKAGSAQTYDLQHLQKFYGQNPMQHTFHLQYFQQPVRDSYGIHGHFDHHTPRYGSTVTQVNSRDSIKGAGIVGLSNDHKPRHSAGASYDDLNLSRGNMPSHHSFRSPPNGGHPLQFPSASVASLAPAKPVGGTTFHGGGYSMSPSQSSSGNRSKINEFQNHSWDDMNSYSILEELKSSKGQRFELSDITGHIVEFSMDQHGSRFIQQKLETCSVEEKASLLMEVAPHASKLMTDVFGNYVIQKLFEYGNLEERKYLTNQLEGQILPLSLQMYGCRVIQKALEVIDLAQKASLVRELDGHVIRCVRDQNGNHVIQKCIESIPTDNIHFIISAFHSQVATLSMHPYGCRVIQRVLEHCKDEIETQFLVDEILDSVCSLAQDQYGNYVVQHVLERGKPRERSEIIEKLAGHIVQLSQHKFASNVVEKCLEFSDSTTRGLLLKEIVGDGDKSDNLLIMMKDQYANYVVQKILQKCTSDQREMLLGLIRNHLTALKKYTYGKRIVARFEQLYGEEMQASGA